MASMGPGSRHTSQNQSVSCRETRPEPTGFTALTARAVAGVDQSICSRSTNQSTNNRTFVTSIGINLQTVKHE